MKYILFTSLVIIFCSCSDAFINHSLKAEKIGECNRETVPVKIISNINGERFEFQYCLDENFDKKNYSVVRRGDSLLLQFAQQTDRKALYKIILDIDAKPPYSSITLGEDGQTIAMKPAER